MDIVIIIIVIITVVIIITIITVIFTAIIEVNAALTLTTSVFMFNYTSNEINSNFILVSA